MVQGNMLSHLGTKYVLPLGTTRHYYEVGRDDFMAGVTTYPCCRNTKKSQYHQPRQSHRVLQNGLFQFRSWTH